MSEISFQPLTKILVPIDGSEPSKRAVVFAGCMSQIVDRVKMITLLHVLAGGYLARHMSNIDVRAGHLIKSDMFFKLKEHHIAKEVVPIMDEAEKILEGFDIKATVNRDVVEGVPVDAISEVAEKGNYSTIVMGRRGLSPVQEVLVGSVTSGLLHKAIHPTVYVVGHKVLEPEQKCPIPRILIPVDGSPGSLGALKEMAAFSSKANGCVEKVILLRVVDIAKYEKALKEGKALEDEAVEILKDCKNRLLNSGIREDKIEMIARYGRPAETILDVAAENDVNIIIIGRKGRSAVKEIVMGSVSSQVLHKAVEPTVAIVCASTS